MLLYEFIDVLKINVSHAKVSILSIFWFDLPYHVVYFLVYLDILFTSLLLMYLFIYLTMHSQTAKLLVCMFFLMLLFSRAKSVTS